MTRKIRWQSRSGDIVSSRVILIYFTFPTSCANSSPYKLLITKKKESFQLKNNEISPFPSPLCTVSAYIFMLGKVAIKPSNCLSTSGKFDWLRILLELVTSMLSWNDKWARSMDRICCSLNANFIREIIRKLMQTSKLRTYEYHLTPIPTVKISW